MRRAIPCLFACAMLIGCPDKADAPPVDYGSAYLGVAGIGVVEVTAGGEIRRVTEPHAYYRGIYLRPDGRLLVKGASDLYLVGPKHTKELDIDGEAHRITIDPETGDTWFVLWDDVVSWSEFGGVDALPREGLPKARLALKTVGFQSVKDGLWLFTAERAFYRRHQGREWREVSPPGGLQGDQFRKVVRQDADRLLVVTDNALWVISGRRWTRTTLPAQQVTTQIVAKGRRVFLQQSRDYHEYQRGGGEMEPVAVYSRDRADGENFWFGASGFQVDGQDRFWGFHHDRVVAATPDGKTYSIDKSDCSLLKGRIESMLIVGNGPPVSGLVCQP